jgi:hypothetical protein
VSSAQDESEVVVGYDADRLWVRSPGKPEMAVSWRDLLGVAIETNDHGPFDADVIWLLGHASGVVPFPQGATGSQEMIQRLQRLPEFDNEQLIAAQLSTNRRTFVLWDRAGRHRANG